VSVVHTLREFLGGSNSALALDVVAFFLLASEVVSTSVTGRHQSFRWRVTNGVSDHVPILSLFHQEKA